MLCHECNKKGFTGHKVNMIQKRLVKLRELVLDSDWLEAVVAHKHTPVDCITVDLKCEVQISMYAKPVLLGNHFAVLRNFYFLAEKCLLVSINEHILCGCVVLNRSR